MVFGGRTNMAPKKMLPIPNYLGIPGTKNPVAVEPAVTEVPDYDYTPQEYFDTFDVEEMNQSLNKPLSNTWSNDYYNDGFPYMPGDVGYKNDKYSKPVQTDAGIVYVDPTTGLSGSGVVPKEITSSTGTTTSSTDTTTSSTGSRDETPEGIAARKKAYDDSQAKIAADAEKLQEKRDAFDLIRVSFLDKGYTKEELVGLNAWIENLIVNDSISDSEALVTLRNLPAYQARFTGNTLLLNAKKNALPEAEYVKQETAYTEYLTAAGQGSFATRERMGTLIGNSISGNEVAKRINLAIDDVQNGDPLIIQQIKRYFPQITDSMLVSYFLDPTQSLAELTKQVGTAQLGAAALGLGKGYDSSLTRAAGLFKQVGSVGAANAKETYQTIGEVLEPTQNLTNVYKEAGITYGQNEAESEFFNKNVKAQEDRKRLKSLARGSFQADPGMGKGALSSPISI